MSLRRFISEHPELDGESDVAALNRIVTVLTNKGVIFPVLGDFILDREFGAAEFPGKDFDPDYGVYEFLVGGLRFVFEEFKASVLPVNIILNSGEPDIGTGFFLSGGRYFCTARHNLENKKIITVGILEAKLPPPLKVYFHVNEKIDLAIIDFGDFRYEAKGVLLDRPFITENIMAIGYPPVPTFDSMLIAEMGEVSSSIKVAAGQIVGSGTAILDHQEYFLVNARVKGGSSGGPVFNERGYVVGMIAVTGTSPDSSVELEGMGYGFIMPGDIIREFRDSCLSGGNLHIEIEFHKSDNGSISINSMR